MDKIARLSQTSIDLVMGAGTFKAGIATTETLKGGPESTDLSYVLPEARSAVVFALPLDQGAIEFHFPVDRQVCFSYTLSPKKEILIKKIKSNPS